MTDHFQATHFPLPLAPFETYMLVDEQPEYPMSFVLEFRFSGTARHEAFRTALEKALKRHPLLNALVDRFEVRKPCWLSSGSRPAVLQWNTEGMRLVEPIDLTTETGLRTWVRQDAGRCWVTMQFHHACCDGVGALRFIDDVLALYDEQDTSTPPCTIDTLRLTCRDRTDAPRMSIARRVLQIGSLLRESLRFIGNQPEPLSSPLSTSQSDKNRWRFPEVVSIVLSEEESQSLFAKAKQLEVSVNDYFLWTMFQVIWQWNEQYGSPRSKRQLCISMPTNMRLADDATMPATNLVTMSFIKRLFRKGIHWNELLESIVSETSEIKRTCRGRYFLKAIRFATYFPRYFERVLKSDRCFTTVVLSNLGDIEQHFTLGSLRESGSVGNKDMVLEEMIGAPPIRPNTRAAFLMSTYRKKLTISLQCDSHWFEPENAQELLDTYVARLKDR